MDIRWRTSWERDTCVNAIMKNRSYGEVYVAEDMISGDVVAVKKVQIVQDESLV